MSGDEPTSSHGVARPPGRWSAPRAQRTPQWLVPAWPAPPSVRALSTCRGGGASRDPYASLNLGDHVEDAPLAVAKNRRTLKEAAGLPAEPSWLTQVHGAQVLDLDATGAGQPGDAVVTGRPGAVCAILTADCLPVLLASAAGTRVGAAHAGWRGLAAGVIEAAVAAMRTPPGEMLAWLGPAIGPQHFEIGPEVREELLRTDPGAEGAFESKPGDRFMADLFALARRRLAAVGVAQVYGGGECTYSQPDQYFSHRRDGRTGRQATLIWLA
jgi:YfiH family protein